MNKYEKLIEHIINDDTEKARALFHNIVVEKSRDIYEGLIDEDDFEIGGNEVTDFEDDVTADEEGLDGLDDDTDNDFDDDGEIDDHESDHDSIEDEVMDLRSALESLQAQFDELMAGEEGEPEHADMFGDDDGGEYDSEDGEEYGEEEYGDDEEEYGDDDDLEDQLVREYIEKVGEPYKGELNRAEGRLVGKGTSTPVNTKTLVAKPNKIGGSNASSKNIVKNAANKNPDGTSVNKGETNVYKKGEGKLKGADNFENVPGAKTKGYTKKETSYEKNKGAEGQTTKGKLAVNTKSEIGGKIR
jgi:hypothetical protein